MTPDAPFDPYAILQVVPTAEQEVVHGAYRALAFKYHPDRDATRRAADKMAALNRAYAVLRDERTRAAHDRSRRTTISGISVGRDRPPGGRAGGSRPGERRRLRALCRLEPARPGSPGSRLPDLAVAPLVRHPLPDRDLRDPPHHGPIRRLIPARYPSPGQ